MCFGFLQIDHEKVSVARDLDHYQNEMLFLKRQLDETEKDIVMLQDSNLVNQFDQSTDDRLGVDNDRVVWMAGADHYLIVNI